MPHQLRQIALRHLRSPDAREAFFHQQCSRWAASRASVFCLRTIAARICAASPIHNSCPNSANMRSNQRVWPVASIPTRTGADSPV
jgi:hypothetical protein